jgi:5S rRNA maturation endonuclease (ribonuclease M5)/transcriptional antiterminator Rof (Rho-off)
MKIAELINKNIFYTKLSSTGFNQCKCPICHDYQDRMGIKFDGDNVGINCFNCQFKARYEIANGIISKNLKKFLLAINIPLEDIEKARGLAFFAPKEEAIVSLEQLKKVNLYTPEVSLPKLCVKLNDTHIDYVNYLQSRKIELDDYPFYISGDKYYVNRIILPFYRHGKIIYWQARSILQNEKKRYLNCEVSKEAVIFNIDKIYQKTEQPLYITEGIFDAILVDGISIIGSKLNEAKITLLKQSRRKLIFVIDKDKNGKLLANQILEHKLGDLTILNEDINKSIIQYGKLFTSYKLAKNTVKSELEKKLLIANI